MIMELRISNVVYIKFYERFNVIRSNMKIERL